jgi:hypothetical protein
MKTFVRIVMTIMVATTLVMSYPDKRDAVCMPLPPFLCGSSSGGMHTQSYQMTHNNIFHFYNDNHTGSQNIFYHCQACKRHHWIYWSSLFKLSFRNSITYIITTFQLYRCGENRKTRRKPPT